MMIHSCQSDPGEMHIQAMHLDALHIPEPLLYTLIFMRRPFARRTRLS